jgi:hypothetical protein
VTAATIRTWDPEGGGTALLDDGSVLEVAPDALQGSSFRFVRPGQRVRAEIVDGVVVRVDLPR